MSWLAEFLSGPSSRSKIDESFENKLPGIVSNHHEINKTQIYTNISFRPRGITKLTTNIEMHGIDDRNLHIDPPLHSSYMIIYSISHDDVIKWKHFRVTGPLCVELTGHRGIPLTKASDAGFWWVFFICAWINGWAKNNREAGDLRRHRDHLWRHCNAHWYLQLTYMHFLHDGS